MNNSTLKSAGQGSSAGSYDFGAIWLQVDGIDLSGSGNTICNIHALTGNDNFKTTSLYEEPAHITAGTFAISVICVRSMRLSRWPKS